MASRWPVTAPLWQATDFLCADIHMRLMAHIGRLSLKRLTVFASVTSNSYVALQLKAHFWHVKAGFGARMNSVSVFLAGDGASVARDRFLWLKAVPLRLVIRRLSIS